MRPAGRTPSPAEGPARSPAAQGDPALPWFELFDETFGQAAERTGRESRALSIGGVRVRLVFAGPALVPAYWPAFEPLAGAPADDARGVEVCVWDSRSTGVAPPRIDWRLEREDAGGYIARYAGPDVLALQEWGRPAFTIARPEAGRAVHHVPAAADVSSMERASSLRFALYALLSSRGRHLIHAGAVGIGGRGALLAGPSGAGKSTLSLACLGTGMQWAGDDYVAIELGPEPRAHAIHATAKVTPAAARELGVEELVTEPPEPPEEKSVLAVPGAGSGLAFSLGVAAILIPRIGAGPPRISEAGAGAAFAALAPTTMVQPSSRGAGSMRAIAELVRQVPSFVVELGPDHRRNAALVRELLGG